MTEADEGRDGPDGEKESFTFFLLPIRGESTFTRKREKKTRQRDTNQPSSSSSSAGHLPKRSEEKSTEDLSPWWAIFLPCLGKRTSNPRKPQVRKAILEGGEMAGRTAQTFARRGWLSWGGRGGRLGDSIHHSTLSMVPIPTPSFPSFPLAGLLDSFVFPPLMVIKTHNFSAHLR